MNIRLEEQTALITGAATGIGRASAIALAQAGANVVVNHLGRAREAAEVVETIERLGGAAMSCQADVTDARQVAAMVDAAVETFGHVDILVNNAGILLEKPFLEMDEDDWDRVIDTDLKSVFLCCQAVLPGMVDCGSGTIINVASELGYLGRERCSAYTAAKAGVITLTRSLAREFAPAIRINAVAPGPIATEMLDISVMSPEMLAKESQIPMNRLGSPPEVAATVVFLASHHAGFYCGQVLSPNGGALMA
jgi:3-oxoacyl-[acyl-carrier protein] reductase